MKNNFNNPMVNFKKIYNLLKNENEFEVRFECWVRFKNIWFATTLVRNSVYFIINAIQKQ